MHARATLPQRAQFLWYNDEWTTQYLGLMLGGDGMEVAT